MSGPKLVEIKPDRQKRIESITEWCRNLLARCEEGEFDGMVVVATRPDGTHVSMASAIESHARMLGALSMAEYDLNKAADAAG